MFITTRSLVGGIVGAALALGCSARSTGLPNPTADDVPASQDAPAVPDVPALPDVPTPLLDAAGPPDAAPPKDAPPAGPDAMTVDGCYVENAAGPLCPSVRGANDASRPSLRVTQLDVRAPAALANAILANTVNDAVRAGGFLWGMTFDLGARSFRTGALTIAARGVVGRGLLDATYRYDAAGDGPLEAAAGRVTGTVTSGTVRLPIYDGTGGLLTELPLDNLRVSATLAPDGGCVGAATPAGGRFNECTSRWTTTGGQITAVITAAAARGVTVAALNTTLCNLLAGSNCDTAAPSAWARRPDTAVNGEPGYTLTADFAAVAATVR